MVHLPIPSKSTEDQDVWDGMDLTLAPSEIYDALAQGPEGDEMEDMSSSNGFTDEDEFPAVFGTDLTRLDRTYIERRNELGEQIILLGKRKLCFWTDGDSSGVPVIAFHGACDTKSRFIQKQPLAGVYLIAVDRPGYGGSSPVPFDWTFKHFVDDILALVQHLGIDKFVVMGHGIGGTFALQIAAAVPQRVKGAIVWSTMADPMHPKATPELRKAQGYRGCLMFARSGTCYQSPRSFMLGSKKVGTQNEFFMSSDDFGVMGLQKELVAGPDFFAKYVADHFWVSQTLDGWRRRRARNAVLGDVNRALCGKWTYNLEDIKCPTFIYHGDGDYDAQCPIVPQFVQSVVPHAHLEVLQGCGHICTFGPNEETRDRIISALGKMA